MKHIYITTILLLLSLSFVHAQTWIETDKVVASDRNDDDYFGFSGVINNDQLILGSYNNRPTGAVYVFDKVGNEWTESYRLQRSETDSFDEFGRRIIVDNNTIIVSDYSTDNSTLYNIGSVYIYQKNASGIWTEQAEIYADTPREYGGFGLETGLDNNTLVVGSDFGNVNVIEFNSGTNTWDFTQELTTSDGLTSDVSVDANGNFIIVGSFDFDENGLNNSGAAYLYEKDANTGAWSETQKILSPDLAAGQRFGKKVFFHNDFLFIASVESQKVYVYNFNATTSQYDYIQTLSGPSGFGQGMDAENNVLVIGAYRHSYTGTSGSSIPQAGSVSTYILNTSTSLWSFDQNFKNADPDNYYWFGNSVSISNEVMLIGSPYNDTDENSMNDEEKAGAAYIFQLDNNLSSEEFLAQDLMVYPNPTQGNIAIKNGGSITKIELFDITGKLLKIKTSNFDQISISELQDGIYLIKAMSNRGARTFKIIKKADL